MLTKQVALFFFSFQILNSIFDEGVMLFAGKNFEKPKIPHSLKYENKNFEKDVKNNQKSKPGIAALVQPDMPIQMLSSKKRRNKIKKGSYSGGICHKN